MLRRNDVLAIFTGIFLKQYNNVGSVYAQGSTLLYTDEIVEISVAQG